MSKPLRNGRRNSTKTRTNKAEPQYHHAKESTMAEYLQALGLDQADDEEVSQDKLDEYRDRD